MNVNKVLTKNYEQMDTWSIRKNEPKTNPNEPKTNPNEPKTNPNKANLSRRSLWRSRIKPNFLWQDFYQSDLLPLPLNCIAHSAKMALYADN